MLSLWQRLFPTEKALEEARAENRAALRVVVKKMQRAHEDGVTVSLSREALIKLRARGDGDN